METPTNHSLLQLETAHILLYQLKDKQTKYKILLDDRYMRWPLVLMWCCTRQHTSESSEVWGFRNTRLNIAAFFCHLGAKICETIWAVSCSWLCWCFCWSFSFALLWKRSKLTKIIRVKWTSSSAAVVGFFTIFGFLSFLLWNWLVLALPGLC